MTEVQASSEVYRQLRDRIVRWQYPPGTPLREAHLAEDLGVSRTPVREALQRLRLEGLVVARGARGVEVPRWTPEELEETYRLRAHVESWAGALAARRADRLDLPKLHDLADKMTELWESGNADPDELAALNLEFHNTVLVNVGSERLLRMMSNVVILPLLYRVFHVMTETEIDSTLREHHTLLLAFEERDPEWAASVTRSHVLGALAALSGSGVADETPKRKRSSRARPDAGGPFPVPYDPAAQG